VKWTVFGAHLLGRVTGHPESFFVCHTYLKLGRLNRHKRVEQVHKPWSNLITGSQAPESVSELAREAKGLRM
jgi:hypothetical protein